MLELMCAFHVTVLLRFSPFKDEGLVEIKLITAWCTDYGCMHFTNLLFMTHFHFIEKLFFDNFFVLFEILA